MLKLKYDFKEVFKFSFKGEKYFIFVLRENLLKFIDVVYYGLYIEL